MYKITLNVSDFFIESVTEVMGKSAIWTILFLSEKNPEKKDSASLTQVFKLLVWVPKIIKSDITVG